MTAALNDNGPTRSFTVLSTGTKISHYKIINKVGAGGMGEVYLAEDTELDRKVALKFLPSYLCPDEDCRKRFKREAQAAAKLSHPNIIHIYEVSEYQGRPFFAMEHVEGRTLGNVIKDDKLDLKKVIELTLQICEGLQEAHEAGVVHRDIKPANIVLDNKGYPKLLDFGLASVRGGEKVTKTGSTLGTVGYMSPEQSQGKEVDRRSDLFSLGVVLYEMITGKAPFTEEYEAATIHAIINETPEPLARYKTRVPEDLQRIVSKLLEKDPDRRYQSAADVMADLNRLKGSGGKAKERPMWKAALKMFLIGCLIGVIFFIIKQYLFPGNEDDREKPKMLAVLPFENLGDPADEYFADGITDEVIASLSKLSGLGVISRTSSNRYKKTSKSLREIGKELGVDYILEGTIKWERFDDENRVRIQPQLIKVDDDIYLWSASYDAVLKEIFELQSRIAREVVNSLNITLMLPERERLDSRVTDNIEAYNYYLQGKNYFDNAVPVSKDEELAIQMFEHAVALDTMFSEAYSWLAHLHAWIHFNTLDRTGQQLTLSKKAAEKAVRFSGNGAAGKSAMGYYYYYGLRDYEAALREFNDALKLQPNNSELLSAIGFVQRRLGLWDEALANLVKASQLDPLSPARILQVVLVLNPTRRNKECLEILDKGIALSPDNGLFYVHKFYVLYNLHEDLDELRELLETASKNFVPNQQVYTVWETYYMWRRDYKAAAAVQPALSNDIYRDTVDFYLAKAIIFMLMKDERASHAYADSVREILEKCITLQPDYYEHYANLGIALALLGRKPEAIEAGQKAVGILPVQKDAYRGFRQLNWLALIYTFVGEKDLALDAVDSLLSIPSFVTVPKLKIDPVYDPLRDHPRFKVIIEKYEKECYGT